ncbi:hypothetical protein AVEN_228748-1 [Araneus ventricosus]|uniref:Uncharacterized protein n=1 Tax=Araneus ventricosus TaxID=182803 RepID=A0A4Y2GKV5_ARAVE|nr:hypothetical protein AVEN_228748-1 [Araneus ventricosus]
MAINAYITKKDVVIERFIYNTPGYDWIKGFPERHPELTDRFANNVKRSRAAVINEKGKDKKQVGRRKVSVEAGKSISHEDIIGIHSKPKTSKLPSHQKKKKSKRQIAESSSGEV